MHHSFRILLPAIFSTAFAYGEIDPATFESDARFFTDTSFSTLKRGITAKDLTELKSEMLKKVAAELLDGTYDKAHRAASYEAYPSPRQLGETLKLGDGFSRYENITGIHLNEGENVVFVGPMHGKEISLLLPDWMR